MLTQLGRVSDPAISRIMQTARRHKEQIDSARDALVVSNLRFVAHMARQMANNSATYLDLIQEGNLGLMEAVERFEYKRGHRFSTYAFWWIRKALHLALAGQSRTIYVPAHVRERVAEVKRATTELTERTGETPAAEEVAEHLCLPVAKIRQLQTITREPTPLEIVDEDGIGRGPVLSIASPESDDPLRIALDRELRRKILACLKLLSTQQQTVVRMRFGIGYERRMTLKEVGRKLSLSRERVRQIEIAALRRLEASPEARSLCGKSSDH
jgi:RNA polymerase primary sigma factor